MAGSQSMAAILRRAAQEFVSALHAPAPHDVTLLVLGPQQVIADLADSEVRFGSIAARLGVGMLHRPTIAFMSSWVTRLLGPASGFLLVRIVFVLNLPSAGAHCPRR